MHYADTTLQHVIILIVFFNFNFNEIIKIIDLYCDDIVRVIVFGSRYFHCIITAAGCNNICFATDVVTDYLRV